MQLMHEGHAKLALACSDLAEARERQAEFCQPAKATAYGLKKGY